MEEVKSRLVRSSSCRYCAFWSLNKPEVALTPRTPKALKTSLQTGPSSIPGATGGRPGYFFPNSEDDVSQAPAFPCNRTASGTFLCSKEESTYGIKNEPTSPEKNTLSPPHAPNHYDGYPPVGALPYSNDKSSSQPRPDSQGPYDGQSAPFRRDSEGFRGEGPFDDKDFHRDGDIPFDPSYCADIQSPFRPENEVFDKCYRPEPSNFDSKPFRRDSQDAFEKAFCRDSQSESIPEKHFRPDSIPGPVYDGKTYRPEAQETFDKHYPRRSSMGYPEQQGYEKCYRPDGPDSIYGKSLRQDGPDSTPYGKNYRHEGLDSVPYGKGYRTEGLDSVPYGKGYRTEGPDSVPYGKGYRTEGPDSVPYGKGYRTEGPDSVPYGKGYRTEGPDSVPYGKGYRTEGPDSVPYGKGYRTEGPDSVPYGKGYRTEGPDSVPYGKSYRTEGPDSVPYGKGYRPDCADSVSYGKGYRPDMPENIPYDRRDSQTPFESQPFRPESMPYDRRGSYGYFDARNPDSLGYDPYRRPSYGSISQRSYARRPSFGSNMYQGDYDPHYMDYSGPYYRPPSEGGSSSFPAQYGPDSGEFYRPEYQFYRHDDLYGGGGHHGPSDPYRMGGGDLGHGGYPPEVHVMRDGPGVSGLGKHDHLERKDGKMDKAVNFPEEHICITHRDAYKAKAEESKEEVAKDTEAAPVEEKKEEAAAAPAEVKEEPVAAPAEEKKEEAEAQAEPAKEEEAAPVTEEASPAEAAAPEAPAAETAAEEQKTEKNKV